MTSSHFSLPEFKAIINKEMARMLSLSEGVWQSSPQETLTQLSQVLTRLSVPFERHGDKGLSADLSHANTTSSLLALRIQIAKKEGALELAIGIGVVAALKRCESRRQQSIRIIFQAESEHPVNARSLISNGVLENASAVLGLSINSSLTAKTVGLTRGAIFPLEDRFTITMRRSAKRDSQRLQAGLLEEATQIVHRISQISTRQLDPLNQVAIRFSSISGTFGELDNTGNVQLSGKIFGLDDADAARMQGNINQMLSHYAHACDFEHNVEWSSVSPARHDDSVLTAHLRKHICTVLGKRKYASWEYPQSCLDDFSEYLKHTPGSILQIGVQSSLPDDEQTPAEIDRSKEHAISAATEAIAWSLLNKFP